MSITSYDLGNYAFIRKYCTTNNEMSSAAIESRVRREDEHSGNKEIVQLAFMESLNKKGKAY